MEAEDLSKGTYVRPKEKKRNKEELAMSRDRADISNRVWTGIQGRNQLW